MKRFRDQSYQFAMCLLGVVIITAASFVAFGIAQQRASKTNSVVKNLRAEVLEILGLQ